jgi:hypothetical protein
MATENSTLKLATRAPVDRDTASKINPLISTINTPDSLEVMSRMVSCMGFLLSQIDNPAEGTVPEFGNLYLLFETISAALDYESDHPKFPVIAAEGA